MFYGIMKLVSSFLLCCLTAASFSQTSPSRSQLVKEYVAKAATATPSKEIDQLVARSIRIVHFTASDSEGWGLELPGKFAMLLKGLYKSDVGNVRIAYVQLPQEAKLAGKHLNVVAIPFDYDANKSLTVEVVLYGANFKRCTKPLAIPMLARNKVPHVTVATGSDGIKYVISKG